MSHTLVLLRHGQSTWNLENKFSGWTDVGLTGRGEDEARSSGRLLIDEGIIPDVVHTSVLRRATETADIALEAAGLEGLPTKRSWRLNERHYGALQGRDKKKTAEEVGREQVLAWRRSYNVRPPALDPDDDRHPGNDPLYEDLHPSDVPATECLADVVIRMLPYWYEEIVPDLGTDKTVLVVAHGNSIRALVKHLDHIGEAEIVNLNIPTGIPLVYELNEEFRPISSRYLGDEEAARAAAEEVARQAG